MSMTLVTASSTSPARDAQGRSSTMSLKGRVAKIAVQSFPAPRLAMLLDGSPAATSSSHAPSVRAASGTVANVVDVRMSGAWAAKCTGLKVGDSVKISNFTVCRAADMPGYVAFDLQVNSGAGPVGGSGGGGGGDAPGSHLDDAPLVSIGTHEDDRPAKAAPSRAAAEQAAAAPFVIEPNDATVIVVSKTVDYTITASDDADGSVLLGGGSGGSSGVTPVGAMGGPHGGLMGGATPTGTGSAGLRGHGAGSSDADPAAEGALNTYAQIGRYYDVINAQRAEFQERGAFIERLIGSRRGALLDVGCGTGTLAHHLAVQGYRVVGVDASVSMGALVAEKARTFGSSVKFVRALIDSPKFSLESVTESGSDVVHTFSTILCIDTLSQLPSLKAIRQALVNITLHAATGCMLVLSILDLAHWGPRIGTVSQEARHYDCGRTSLAVTAASVPPGTVDVVTRTYVDKPSSGEECAEVTSEVTALILHPRADRPTQTLIERTVERAVAPAYLESLVEGLGWSVRDVYNRMAGDNLAVDTHGSASPVRVYVLMRD